MVSHRQDNIFWIQFVNLTIFAVLIWVKCLNSENSQNFIECFCRCFTPVSIFSETSSTSNEASIWAVSTKTRAVIQRIQGLCRLVVLTAPGHTLMCRKSTNESQCFVVSGTGSDGSWSKSTGFTWPITYRPPWKQSIEAFRGFHRSGKGTCLLHVIHEIDEIRRGLGVGDQEQYLRPPVLDMVLASVKHQKILPDLVEQQGLTDAAPRQREVTVMQGHDEEQEQKQRDLKRQKLEFHMCAVLVWNLTLKDAEIFSLISLARRLQLTDA